ncbi:MAG: IS110 family transposase [Gemmatimonadales bacterium]|nr:IS110 family transposase [Gemmatimonadales bacterium]
MQIGVDLAKTVFEVAISDAPGVVTARRRLSRAAFPRFLAGQAPAEVLLEACGSAHHWGREAARCGHRVTLLHPADVARYRDGNKTDRADAKALLEASRNHALTPAPVKSVEQQAVLALHRIRQGYLRTRTARINALRGHLRELGHTIPVGARRVTLDARAALTDDTIPPFLHAALLALLEEIHALEHLAESIRTTLAQLVPHMPEARRLMTVPGIGVLTATAMVASVGDIRRFRSGRHFASWLGLTPREHSSGASRCLGSITRKGNSYLRMLLIHGARSALRAGAVTNQPDDLRTWAAEVSRRHCHNVAAVALANKLARICWRAWRDGRDFERREAQVTHC